MRWVRSVSAVSCTVVLPGTALVAALLARGAYRLVCPIGEAIDAVVFPQEEE